MGRKVYPYAQAGQGEKEIMNREENQGILIGMNWNNEEECFLCLKPEVYATPIIVERRLTI